MRYLIFAVLAVLCVSCNKQVVYMHFGPGPGTRDSIELHEEEFSYRLVQDKSLPVHVCVI